MGTGRLEEYRVSGNSMLPLLRDGQVIQVSPARVYKIGDIVVAKHPIQTDLTIVKQIHSILEDGLFKLRGINTKESSDRFGCITQNEILGRMTLKS